ncbi:hypothetical protein COF37_26225 [Bacillus wiedmannii]|nr:hypothetical protein [Bacillus wiedmannii]PHD18302.1 hypothetical protein COF37_26225 [Bacillus wiedmannii]
MKKFIAGLVIVCTLALAVSPVSNEIAKVKEPVKMKMDPGTIG